MRRQNIKHFLFIRGVHSSSNASKPVFGRGSVMDLAGGVYDALQDTLVGLAWGHSPVPKLSPSTPLASRSQSLGAYRPLQEKFLATPMVN